MLKTIEALCLLLGLSDKSKDSHVCFEVIKERGDISEDLAKFDRESIPHTTISQVKRTLAGCSSETAEDASSTLLCIYNWCQFMVKYQELIAEDASMDIKHMNSQ